MILSKEWSHIEQKHTSDGYMYMMSHVVRKLVFSISENKEADQLRSNAKLISAFVFATLIVQSLYFLNLKFQASSHIQ